MTEWPDQWGAVCPGMNRLGVRAVRPALSCEIYFSPKKSCVQDRERYDDRCVMPVIGYQQVVTGKRGMAVGFSDKFDFSPILGWELYQVTLDKHHVMFWFEGGHALLNVAEKFSFVSAGGSLSYTYELYGAHKSLTLDSILRLRIKGVRVCSKDELELTFENGDRLIIHDNPMTRSWWFLWGQHTDQVSQPSDWAFEIGDREPEDMTDEERRGRLAEEAR